jgi:RNA polymerase sigma factor (sigma-70 family)
LITKAYTGPIERDQERKLIRQAQRGSLEARNDLLMHYLPLIRRWCQEINCRGYDYLDDLLGEGILGFWEAVERFDLSMGTRLSTYASFWVKQSARRAMRSDMIIRAPQHAFARERLRPAAEAATQTVSLDSLDHSTYNAAISCPPPDAETVDSVRWLQQALKGLWKWRPAAYQVLKWRLRNETLKAIGERMGLSRERIRQIEFEAIRFLRKLWVKEFGDTDLAPPLGFGRVKKGKTNGRRVRNKRGPAPRE